MPKKATPAENTVNREYKSSIFAMLFRDKTKLLELYNTISGTSYIDPDMPLREAVGQAITECIREGILEDFLKKNRAEAMKVSIYEYDARKHIEMEREDSYKDGRADMLHQIIHTMLSNGRTVSQIAAELKMEEDIIAEIAGEQKEDPA